MADIFKKINIKLSEEFFVEHFSKIVAYSSYKDVFLQKVITYTLFWKSEYAYFEKEFFFVSGGRININTKLINYLPLEGNQYLNDVYDNILSKISSFDILISDEISSEFVLRWK